MDSPEPASPERLKELFGAQEWITDLDIANPNVATGLGRFTEVATRDAALPGCIKLLYMASIAAAKQHPDLVAVLLRSAIDSGLTTAQAQGAAAVLVLSRGALAASHFLDGLHAVVGPPPDSPTARTPKVETKDALDYVISVYGDVPPRVQLMIDEVPGALESLHLLRSAALGNTGLASKYSELLLVCLNSALYEPDFVESHARDARDEGATEGELAEAVAAAVPLGGMAAWSTGASAIVASRAKGSRRAGG